MNYKKIGIVIADREEYASLSEQIVGAKEFVGFNMRGITFRSGFSEVFAICCGIGKVNAATAAAFLIERGCEVILNYGLSGGLLGVHRGDIVLPDRFLEHDFDLTGIGYKPCEKPGQEYVYSADEKLLELFKKALGVKSGGTAVSGDSFICDSVKKNNLIKSFGASCCDMETAAMASVCHAAGVPFAAMRRISDDAGEDAADTYRSVNTNEGDILAVAFLKCLNALTEGTVE